MHIAQLILLFVTPFFESSLLNYCFLINGQFSAPYKVYFTFTVSYVNVKRKNRNTCIQFFFFVAKVWSSARELTPSQWETMRLVYTVCAHMRVSHERHYDEGRLAVCFFSFSALVCSLLQRWESFLPITKVWMLSLFFVWALNDVCLRKRISTPIRGPYELK